MALATDYYVLTAPSPTTLTCSATQGGSVLNITGTGSGVHSLVTGANYAKEFERLIFSIEVNDQQLSLGTRFSITRSFLLSLNGNCDGYYRFTMLRGTPNATRVANSNLSSITTDEVVIDVPIVLTSALSSHTFGYAVERSTGNALTATKQIYTQKDIAATAPGSPRFTLVGLLTRFDVEDVSQPVGQVTLTAPVGEMATIVPLT
jgi:hypothetical protein